MSVQFDEQFVGGASGDFNARIVNETSNDIKGLPVNFSLDENVVAYTTCDVNANSHADVNMQFVVDEELNIFIPYIY